MKQALGKWLLVAWALLLMVALGSLGVSHTVAMPQPTRGERLAQTVLALRGPAQRPLFVHVIAAGCSCTERLFEHLLQRRAGQDGNEEILFVGEAGAKQAMAERAGYAFHSISARQLLDRFGLEAAPVLLALDATGRLRYAGGYYDHPAAILPHDEKILAQLAQGASPQPLPVYGCAVSPQLRKSIDPLGIVYPAS
jgi:hypothetical protein